MNYFFITGSSKGLGYAIVKELLETSTNFVLGLSRHNSISQTNFRFIELDLLNQNLVDSFIFPELDNITSLTLINNAGIIGDIKPTGTKTNKSIRDVFQVNSIAPAVLINTFIKKYQSLGCGKTILNISSGAGRHTINSWADYCASKSALDMHSKVVSEEQKEQKHPIKILSVAPGIIDTDMQIEIRSSNPNDFKQLEYFKDLKSNFQLSNPSEIAKKLIQIIETSHKYSDVLLDVRDI